jgi:hypothetical protein
MFNEIETIIHNRLISLSLFATIGTALRCEDPKRPSVLTWLAEDKEVTDAPKPLREVSFVAKVAVNHNDVVGGAALSMNTLLDAVRTVFAGWMPDNVVGIQKGFRVPLVKITEFTDHGPTEYLVQLTVRVWPDAFRINI